MINVTDKIMELSEIQNKLNTELAGENWIDGVTAEGKDIDWDACIIVECAELIESFPYKHWKDINKQPDIENAKMELVDILHFILSKTIKLNNGKSMNRVLLESYIKPAYKCDVSELSISDSVAELIGNNCDEPEVLVYLFVKLTRVVGVDMEEISTIYRCKYVLNLFRTHYGYKEGAYKKDWGGIEDNEYLMSIPNVANMTIENIYAELDHKYNSL